MRTASYPVFVALLGVLGLSACSAPRGAGLQREVLAEVREAEAGSVEAAAADFSLEPVTRQTLPMIQSWYVPEETGRRWLTRSQDPQGLLIAAGDRLSITVWDPAEQSLLASPGQRSVVLDGTTVSPDGRIFLPYIGQVRVAGMSPDHAREVIEERFLEVVPSAQVQLEAGPGAANAVSVVGGVGAPGTVPLAGRDRTILNVLAEAGGVQPSLNNPQIRLIRGGQTYGTSVSRLFADPDLDTTVMGGDRIIVEPDRRYFLSLGAAGEEAMHPFPHDDLTALEAMSVIGGLSDDRANPKGILLLREYPQSAVRQDRSGPDNTRVVFVLDLTTADGLFSAGQFPIQSDDLVYVSESPLTLARTIIGVVGNVFGLARQANAIN